MVLESAPKKLRLKAKKDAAANHKQRYLLSIYPESGCFMYVKWIHVENYRNLHDVEIAFHEKFNYFVGEHAIGKTNLLDLMQSVMNGEGFKETDFLNPQRPIRVTFSMAVREEEQDDYLDQESVLIEVEQVVQEIYPRMYRIGETREEIPLGMLRRVLYVCHRSSTEEELQAVPPGIYRQLSRDLAKIIPEELHNSVMDALSVRYFSGAQAQLLDPDCYDNICRLISILDGGQQNSRYTADNIRLVMTVAFKLLTQIYVKFKSVAVNMESSVIITKKGKRYLPIFISVDEPELHLSPFLQRAVLAYYRRIVDNENERFLHLLKQMFDLDGLMGQLFIVTHSTDALVDDYRNIIRFYRNGDEFTRAACGSEFKFPLEVEKHLIMHFPEAKEALYSRCVIIVEGETEASSFRSFGKSVQVDFDYFGICLINARGESSISKLAALFKRFSIPTVVLYDNDVSEKYTRRDPNIVFTEELCYEMDLVKYLLSRRRRPVLDAIVQELTENGKGAVTRDMLRKGLGKLSVTKGDYPPRVLRNISDRQDRDLLIYYFSWFFSNKGVIIGRCIGMHLDAEDIPPAFRQVIERAHTLATG